MNSIDYPRIIVALDYPDLQSALPLVNQLDPALCQLKVGLELFTKEGIPAVNVLIDKGFYIFLDLKLHDIPNTVAQACKQMAIPGISMFTLHAAGGYSMLQASLSALEALQAKPLLLAVTILTSLDQEDLKEIGYEHHAPEDQVLHLAKLAERAGMPGLVCSGQEAGILRQAGFKGILVTPGIRFKNNQQNDQKRIMTPQAALKAGADFLVIGRAITQQSEPKAILQQIYQDIQPFC